MPAPTSERKSSQMFGVGEGAIKTAAGKRSCIRYTSARMRDAQTLRYAPASAARNAWVLGRRTGACPPARRMRGPRREGTTSPLRHGPPRLQSSRADGARGAHPDARRCNTVGGGSPRKIRREGATQGAAIFKPLLADARSRCRVQRAPGCAAMSENERALARGA